MNLGEKIVRLRKDKGMSQERLAEVLEVSRQAVYKWEINESVPDMGKISKMVELFGVSYDFLLNDKIGFDDKPEQEKEKEADKAPVPEEEAPVEEPASDPIPDEEAKPAPNAGPTPVVANIFMESKKEASKVPESKKVLGKCEVCGKEITDPSELMEHPATFSVNANGVKNLEKPAWTECKSCYNKTLLVKYQGELDEIKKDNKKAIIIGSIVTAVIFAILLASGIASGETSVIIASIVIGILLFPTIYSIVLDNTFAGELWDDVSSWGFVRMPGIIFSLDFDGIVFLILTKILLTILSFLLALFCVILATAICAVCSPITFPLAIVRYRRQKNELEDNISKVR